MNQHINFNLDRLLSLIGSIVLLFTCGIGIIILIMLSVIAIASQWSQITRTSISSLNITSSQTTSTTGSSLPNAQDQQILTEAQEDVAVANDIIEWSAFFIAFLATGVTIASFFGIREGRRIQELRTKLEADSQAINKTKEKVEADFKQLKDQVETDFEQIKKGFEQLKDRVETDFKELNKRFESESQTFIEASYNFGVATNAYKIGDNVRAVEYYLQVLRLQPENIRVMERLGRAYSNLNDMPKAIQYLEQALSIDASFVPALRSLALCYRYDDKDKAIDYFKRALNANSSDNEAWDFLGLIYRDNGRINEAIDAHEQALAIKRRPETQFFLSILYVMKGDKKRAKLMSLNAEDDLQKREFDEKIRPVWKILIRAGVYIMEDNEDEAYKLIKTLPPYITTQRIYKAVTGHLNFLLEATGHKDWIPKFTDILPVKET